MRDLRAGGSRMLTNTRDKGEPVQTHAEDRTRRWRRCARRVEDVVKTIWSNSATSSTRRSGLRRGKEKRCCRLSSTLGPTPL